MEFGDLNVALPTLNRPLHLLDLRQHGAMRAGTVAAIGKCEYRMSQPWSRYFYETRDDFDEIDGLIYLNAHNDEPAIILYERASAALACPPEAVIRLDHPELRPALIEIMRRHNLTF